MSATRPLFAFVPGRLRVRLYGPVAWLLAASAAAWCAGCGGGGTVSGGAPGPVLPAGGAELAGHWYHAWEKQEDILGERVRDMFLILGTRGRDWRRPPGPDGYPVRIVLLDRADHPVRADGTIQAFLVRSPEDYDAQALCCWSVDAGRAGRYFREDFVAGYLLQLDWGAYVRGGGQTFMLVVRWSRPDGPERITRNIVFKDRIPHVTSQTTTTRTAPAPGRPAPEAP